MNTAAVVENTPWWRVGMVWLVVGGPFVVVVAAIVTAVIAIRGADPVISAPSPQAGQVRSESPAQQGRNHAATAATAAKPATQPAP